MDPDQLEERLRTLEVQQRQSASALNGALCAFCVLLGLWNLYMTILIPRFADVFDQMLDGKELPNLTRWVLNSYPLALGLAAALPAAAMILFFTMGRRAKTAWILLAFLFVIGVTLVLMRFALWRPLFDIVSDMSAG